MSSNTPFGPGDGSDPTESVTPEYLGSGPRADGDGAARSARNWPLLGATAAGVVAVMGLGGWGAYALLSGGGAQPADAIPDSAFAYVSVDLDPSASQKIEALRILNKFPAIKEELGISGTDDMRRAIFEEMQSHGTCENVDYDEDVRPWIGDRIALAVVPSGGKSAATPLMALQISDQEAAAAGIDALAACAHAGDHFGFAFSDDYVLVTDSDERAEALVADAAEGSLAGDADFTRWTEEAGDPGIVTMYAAPDAPQHIMDMQHMMDMNAMSLDPTSPEAWMGHGERGAPTDQMRGQMQALYKDFEGMAVTLRFEDGAAEAEFAGQGVPGVISSADEASAPKVTELPASTAAAFSYALPDGWLDTFLDSTSAMDGVPVDKMLAEGEAQTGLDLPEDIETLLGDGVSLSLDSDIDIDAVLESQDPSGLPVGLRVSGDPDEILPVFEKLKAAIGSDADMLVGEAGDGMVAFGVSTDYVKTLLETGSLGDEDSFQRVVPDAEQPTGLLYVNFDAGDGWAERFAESLEGYDDGSAEPGANATASANVAPLDALGLATWTQGEVQRGLFRVTTD